MTRLEDGSLLTYTDAVQHQLVAAFSSCRTVAAHRERFLQAWRAYREAAVESGRTGAVRAYVLEPGGAPLRAERLAVLLERQGIEVRRVTAAAAGIAEGSYLVPMDQPLGRLAQTLLQPEFSMGKAFEKEQERRDSKRLGEQIYDVTGWSLPLLWQVPVRAAASLPAGLTAVPVEGTSVPEGAVEGSGTVAFLMPWNSIASARAAATLLRGGVKLYAAGKAFTIGGRHYHRGTVVVRRADNGADLPAKLQEVARETGVTFYGTDTSYSEEGVDLGSANVRWVKPPRVALLWDLPTSPTGAGAERYAMEYAFGYPVTVVRTASLGHADLGDFDVIIMPDATRRFSGYGQVLGKGGAARLAGWVREGGVLVGIGAGAAYLTEENVGLLASSLEPRDEGQVAAGGKDEGVRKPAARDAQRTEPEKEMPPNVPGAILRVELDPDSIFSAGYPSGHLDVMVDSNRVFTPLKLDQGANVAVYAPEKDLLQSGFILEASRRQLPGAAYLMEQRHGRGRVIAFAEDPAYRGFTEGSMLLLADAVFLGPVF